MSRLFFLLAAVPFVLLGFLHGLYTLRDTRGPVAFWPRAEGVREAMQQTTPLLTRRTSLWDAWMGFNFSHSLGAVLFGVVLVVAGRTAETFEREAGLYLPLALLVVALYLAIGLRYWFRSPLIGIAFGAACLVVSALLRLAGR